MIKFIVTEQGKKDKPETQEWSIDQVKIDLQVRFALDDNVAIYQELRRADGRLALSLRDRYNKIIIQYKTAEPLND